MDFKVDLTAIAVVSVIFTATAVMVATALHFAHRARELRHQTIRAALERGQPLPLQLLEGSPRGPRASDLTRGVKAAFFGVGLSLFFWLVHRELWPVGLIVLFLGLGFLAAHWLSRGLPDAPTAG